MLITDFVILFPTWNPTRSKSSAAIDAYRRKQEHSESVKLTRSVESKRIARVLTQSGKLSAVSLGTSRSIKHLRTHNDNAM